MSPAVELATLSERSKLEKLGAKTNTFQTPAIEIPLNFTRKAVQLPVTFFDEP